MSRGHCLTSLLIAVGGFAACDGGFTPAQPVLGHILYEWQGTVPAGGVTPGGPLPTLLVPGSAVPSGTTLTFRLLSPIAKSPPAGWPLPDFGGEVLQILPEGLTFSPPILYSSTRFSAVGQRVTTAVPINHLFRADDNDSAWTWSASAPMAINAQDPILWPVDRSGLWIRGEAPGSALAGTYRLLATSCKGSASIMATPLSVFLTLTADHYALTGAAPPCHDEGPFTGVPFALTTGARTLGFDALVNGTALQLKTAGDFLGTCGAASAVSIVLYLDYLGCSTDADCGMGGRCGGELCGPAPSTATASCLADVTGAMGTK